MISHVYQLDDLPADQAIDIVEDRGRIVYRIAKGLTPEQIVSALNTASQAVLAGGHWFQEWHGDIITIDAPHGSAEVPLPR